MPRSPRARASCSGLCCSWGQTESRHTLGEMVGGRDAPDAPAALLGQARKQTGRQFALVLPDCPKGGDQGGPAIGRRRERRLPAQVRQVVHGGTARRRCLQSWPCRSSSGRAASPAPAAPCKRATLRATRAGPTGCRGAGRRTCTPSRPGSRSPMLGTSMAARAAPRELHRGRRERRRDAPPPRRLLRRALIVPTALDASPRRPVWSCGSAGCADRSR